MLSLWLELNSDLGVVLALCLALNVRHLLDLAIGLDLNLSTDLGLTLGLGLQLRLCRSHSSNNRSDWRSLHVNLHC